MPYMHEWVEPAIFVEFNGVKVYHTYRNDDIEERTSEYHYTTDKYETDYKSGYSKSMFDVRELPNWTEDPHPPYLDSTMAKKEFEEIEFKWKTYHDYNGLEKHIREIIKEAIETGHITSEE